MLQKETVVGLFENMKQADGAMAELHSFGIPKADIKSVDSRSNKDQLVEATRHGSAGMIGLLKHLFGADHRLETAHGTPLYDEWVQKGGVLVAVNTDAGSVTEVTKILETYGSVETGSRAGRTGSPEKAIGVVEQRSTRPSQLETNKDERTIEVIEEELHIGKRKVEKGSVRVVKHVTETPVEGAINLREETVTIERRSVDRLANETDLKELVDSSVEMIETSEEPVVVKEPHVREEITISRKIVDHEEKIRDKVKKTQVDIEGLEPARARDVEFKKDFTTRFGKLGRNYSDYAPAYELGSNLASDARYRNRDWSDVENEARNLWESKRQGSWKDFSEAVRQGWQTIRGRKTA